MNQMIPREEKDIRLKEKIKAEADYAIHMAVTALKDVYDRGELIESEHSKECVWELRRLSDSVCAFLEEKLVKEKGKAAETQRRVPDVRGILRGQWPSGTCKIRIF